MKSCLAFAVPALVLLLSSCVASERGLVLAPVGPPPAQPTTTSAKGTLVVFSAYDVHEASPGDYECRHHYSDYRIFSGNGKLLQRVHNDSDSVLREPAHVRLPAGMYRVVADSNGYGVVTVPVVIEANQVTTVHLEDGGWQRNASGLNEADAVHLPGGEIVGWRSAATEQLTR